MIRRIWEHKEGIVEGVTKKYAIKNLVYYEKHDTAESAIRREKRLKEWKRQWKLKLIEGFNPTWIDLYENILA